MTEFPIRDKFKDAQEILLPQFFCRKDTGILFGDIHDEKVDKENFRTGFSLDDKDTEINFDNLNYEIVSLDVYDKEDFPRYKVLSDSQIKQFLEYFDNLTPEGKIRQCALKLAVMVDTGNNPPSQQIVNYIEKIVSRFDRERIREAVQSSGVYARKIKAKINSLLDDYAEKKFKEQIDAKKIFAKPSHKLPRVINPTRFKKNWANSLYVAEEDVNNLEFKVASAMTSLDNVLWWHRNRVSKTGFCINGFINHYPDFIVKMKSGVILLVETKGDDRDNSDSKIKLELGKIWESKADSNKYGYFMVFDNNPLNGALSFDEFISRMKGL